MAVAAVLSWLTSMLTLRILALAIAALLLLVAHAGNKVFLYQQNLGYDLLSAGAAYSESIV
jgi:hypothetical protein